MSIGWTEALAALDRPPRQALTKFGMPDPVIIAWAFDIEISLDGMVDDDALRSQLEDLLLQIDLEEDGALLKTERLDAVDELLYAIQQPANAHQERADRSSDFELTLDLAELDRYERDKRGRLCLPRRRWRPWPPAPRNGGERPTGGGTSL